MSYSVILKDAMGKKVTTLKIIREKLGIGMKEAMNLVENTPSTIISDVSYGKACEIRTALIDIGAEAVIEGEDEAMPLPAVIQSQGAVHKTNENVAVSGSTGTMSERETLLRVWHDYTQRAKTQNQLKNKIAQDEDSISSTKKCIADIKRDIEKNKKIVDSGGESLRPWKAGFSTMFGDVLGSAVLAFIFTAIAGAILTFVAALVMVCVSPETIEKLAETLNVGAGSLVWLGSPVLGIGLGVAAAVVAAVVQVVKNVIFVIEHNKSREAFDPEKAKMPAVKFMNDIDKHLAEISTYESRIGELEIKIRENRRALADLPLVSNPISMPSELRSAKGIEILLQYLDNGRAYSVKEAVNLYYQDAKDAARFAEIQKQTEFTRLQAEYSRIAAENTEKTLQEQRRAADAAERTASSAAWSAVATSFGAQAAQEAASAASRTANAAEELAYYAKRS